MQSAGYAPAMITPEQCRSARAWLDWSQEELAGRASLALSTVRDFEKGRRLPIANNIVALEKVFAEADVTFFESGGEVAGIRAKYRITERDVYLPALTILSAADGGFMKMSDLIKALEEHFNPEGEDAQILAGRSDTRFSQIVRNIVSHRDDAGNMINDGLADYDGKLRGLRITEAGRRHAAAGT